MAENAVCCEGQNAEPRAVIWTQAPQPKISVTLGKSLPLSGTPLLFKETVQSFIQQIFLELLPVLGTSELPDVLQLNHFAEYICEISNMVGELRGRATMELIVSICIINISHKMWHIVCTWTIWCSFSRSTFAFLTFCIMYYFIDLRSHIYRFLWVYFCSSFF